MSKGHPPWETPRDSPNPTFCNRLLLLTFCFLSFWKCLQVQAAGCKAERRPHRLFFAFPS